MGNLESQAEYYKTPRRVVLEYSHIVEDPFPEPQEAEVTFKINGHSENAFVPLRNVDRDNKHVVATILGENQDSLVVSFPPTNFGQTTFSARKADLEAITVEQG